VAWTPKIYDKSPPLGSRFGHLYTATLAYKETPRAPAYIRSGVLTSISSKRHGAISDSPLVTALKHSRLWNLGYEKAVRPI